MIDWRRLGIVVLVLSCGKSVPIEDKPCPCLAGYLCCPANNRCQRVCEAADAGVDSNAPGDATTDQVSADQRPPSGPNEPTTDRWTRFSAENGPDPTSSAVWTGTEMIVWGGSTGARYNPATDRWTTMSTLRSPRPGLHTAVWTGKEVLVWGGNQEYSGGRYDPATDSWRAMSIENAPSSRMSSYAAVWTGSQMVLWGGGPPDGGRYDPVADKWTAVSSAQAPPSPWYLSAFWIGREVFLFGGYGPGGILRSGLGLYDPVADSWRPIPTAGAPDPRVYFNAAFTGKEVIVWGGNHAVPPNGSHEAVRDGAAYDVAAGTWRPISTTDAPGPSNGAITVWADGAGTQGTGLLLVLGAGIYDPPSNKWWTMSAQGAPPMASAAVWTGRDLLVWVNNGDPTDLVKGGWRYRP
jgi:hypothetical protein